MFLTGWIELGRAPINAQSATLAKFDLGGRRGIPEHAAAIFQPVFANSLGYPAWYRVVFMLIPDLIEIEGRNGGDSPEA